MELVLKKLNTDNIEMIKEFFVNIFTKEPWNDDWSDENQLHKYIMELIGCYNSLTLGYFHNDEMIALSMGRIKHWYTGTEYIIDELAVAQSAQGKGVGTMFLKAIEEYIVEHGMVQIYLHTERNVPAYNFYRKNGFYELTDEVALAKELI